MLQNWVVSLNRWKIKALKIISTFFFSWKLHFHWYQWNNIGKPFHDHRWMGRAPEKSLNFPAKVYKDNRKKFGEMRRFCLHEWFHAYKFLAHSKSSNGLFCLACTLFPMAAYQGSKTKLLILQPYRNWKDTRSNLSHHTVLQYHKDSMEALNIFVSCFQNPNKRVSIWNYPRWMLLQNLL